jgi:FkbM family methyltransferase
VPAPIAKSLEWRLQKAQGKGIGYASVKEEVRTLKFFTQSLGLSGVQVLDVGANTGQYGLEVISTIPGVELHSFEPSSLAFEKLNHLAGSHQNWYVYNIGFGSANTSDELFFAESGSASATLLRQEKVFGREESFKSESVQIRVLDDFLDENIQINANVLKLDIEGYEMRCLEGAVNSIAKFRIIQFEFGEVNVDARIFFRDYWNFFSDRGFEVYRVTKRRPIRIYKYSEDLETFSVTNYLAVRK